jgi:tetratricopeptide (TPR) repeat protein
VAKSIGEERMSTGIFGRDPNQAIPQNVDTLRRALVAHGAGRLGEAELCCRLVLAANKKQFDALHLLGLIEFQRGRLDEAHRLIRQALKVNPRSVQAHSNFGLVLQHLGRHKDALASLDRALAIEPDNLLALNNRGHVLWRLKRSQEALADLDRALAIKPDYGDAHCNRGNALVDLQRLDEALVSYDRALTLNTHDASLWNNRGNVLWALNRREEAMQSYDQALALDPDDLSTLKDRGTALLYWDRGEEALACFDRGLALKPDDSYFLYKRGTTLAHLNRYDEALDCFDRALAVQPDYVDVLGNRGNVLGVLQRAADAIASFDQALAINPDTAEAHWNRGLVLLRTGDFDQGWKEYEWRWKTFDYAAKLRDFREPLWLGEQPIEGRTILIYFEGGLGDTIHFVRYVPLVAALGARVIVEVQPALKTLLSGIEGAAAVIGKGEEPPPFDFRCPLLSLPLAFKTRLETIPAATPYLSASAQLVATWSDRLAKVQRPRIGVTWAGNPNFLHDKTRSIGLARLAPLLSVPGIQFIGIQKDLRAGDDEILRQHPQVIHLGEELADFSDTAAIMSLLDLVISSDTSVVHLAGALGRPVWVLLEHTPEWRWMLDRDDNPWYPSARLFRQPTLGDWGSVVARVADELAQWCDSGSCRE